MLHDSALCLRNDVALSSFGITYIVFEFISSRGNGINVPGKEGRGDVNDLLWRVHGALSIVAHLVPPHTTQKENVTLVFRDV